MLSTRGTDALIASVVRLVSPRDYQPIQVTRADPNACTSFDVSPYMDSILDATSPIHNFSLCLDGIRLSYVLAFFVSDFYLILDVIIVFRLYASTSRVGLIHFTSRFRTDWLGLSKIYFQHVTSNGEDAAIDILSLAMAGSYRAPSGLLL
jgi:hypothetical protein